MLKKTIVHYSDNFVLPLDTADFEFLKSADLSYYNQKFINYYFQSIYPDNSIISGLELIQRVNNTTISYTITKGVAIADKIVICISSNCSIEDDISNLPNNITQIVYLYHNWSKSNRYLKPEIHINYITNNEQLYYNLDINKGFILLGCYDIIHNNTTINSIIRKDSVNINNVTYTINKYSSSLSGNGNNIIKHFTVDNSILNTKQINIGDVLNHSAYETVKMLVISSHNFISPVLTYPNDFNVNNNIISWNGCELENLIELNDVLRVEYVF